MILKFAIRNLVKRRLLNFIKVAGLSLSLSGILLIALFLKNELTFDRFHKKHSRIYRFTTTHPDYFDGKHFARIYNASYIPALADYFPAIENYVRLAPVRGGVIKYKERFVSVNQAFECDSTFFNVFDARLLVGNPATILDNPGSMVISESYAKKIFGDNNPVGQLLTLPAGQFYGKSKNFTVKGIMKDFPQNSHFHPDFIAAPTDRNIFNGWAWTYLLLSAKANPNDILSGFKDFFSSQVEGETGEIKTTPHLQNIHDIHLHSDKLREIEANGNMYVIYTLFAAALILLLIALTNYAGLSIGMAYFNNKYLFVSKVSGSSGLTSTKYFFTEGIIIVTASVLISGFTVILANLIIQRHFGINLFKGNILLFLLVTVLFCLLGILSGILPLINGIMRNIRSTANYKSKNHSGGKGISKGLIVLQYTISIALIVAVFVIHRQTNYALKNSMGAGNDNLICFKDVHTDIQSKFEVFKQELLKYNSVESVSAMFEPPGGEANDMFRFTMDGYVPDETHKEDSYIGVFPCDYSFASIFNLKFLAGDNFSEKNEDNEGSGEYIINEAAMQKLHYTSPDEIIGKRFGLIFGGGGIEIPEGKIIGVVKDFHLSSLKKKIEPLVLFKRKSLWLINIVVSFRPGTKTKALADIKTVWTRMFPEYPFQYEYVSSMYVNVYKTERLQVKLLSVFTFIALFTCSMGLLGLSLLVTRRRIMEIGIRKVNGARTGSLMILLSWNFVKWILISFVLAAPISLFAMTRWLEGFAYKTSLSWWIFGLAGVAAIAISFITVSINSWRAANKNPVETLRYE